MLSNNLLISTIKRTKEVLTDKFKKRAVLVLTLLFVNSILELLGLAAVLPVIMLMLQDNAVEKNVFLSYIYTLFGFSSSKLFVGVIALLVLLILALKNIASLWIAKIQASFSFDLYKDISTKLLKYYYSRGFLFFKEHNATYISRNINEFPLQFANNIVINSLTMINELIILVLVAVSIFVYDPFIIILLVGVILPAFLLFYSRVKRQLLLIHTELHDIQPEIGKNVFQSIYGYVDVMIANAEEEFRNRHSKMIDRGLKLRIKDKVLQLAPTKVIEMAMMGAVIFVALYGVFFVDDKSHLIGLISVFALAAYRILPSINRMMVALMGIKSFQFTFDTVLLAKDVSESDHDSARKMISFNHRIDISGIGYTFPNGREVLNNISFTIEKGSKVGLVGRSGSGKSTLVNLLLGFLSPTKGAIYIDNEKLEDNVLNSWRSQIAYVPQDVFIIDATLAENVAFGTERELINDEEVIKALKTARLDSFLSQLPEGLNTQIGERGAMISGGQRQRVGIARALYKKVNVLVLDEATSALDNETERELTEALNDISEKGLTLIIIAHRLTTLRDCNIIYEMEEGKLARTWNYTELINDNIHIG